MKSGGGSVEDGGDGASQTPSGGASSSNTSEGVTKSLKSMLDDMCPVLKKKTRDSDSDGEDDEKPKKGRRVSKNNQTPDPKKDSEVRPAFCLVLVSKFSPVCAYLPGRSQEERAAKYEQGHQRVRAPNYMQLAFEIHSAFAMLRLRSLAKKARTIANELHEFPGNDVQGLADD